MYKDPKIPKESKDAKVHIVLNFAQTINTARMYSVKTVKYSKIHLKIEFEKQPKILISTAKLSIFDQKCPISVKNAIFIGITFKSIEITFLQK